MVKLAYEFFWGGVGKITFNSDGEIGYLLLRRENTHDMKYQKKLSKFILHSFLYIHLLKLTYIVYTIYESI